MQPGPTLQVLAGFCACAVTILAAGVTAVRALGLDLKRAETLCLGYALGCPIASAFTLALALLGAARMGVFAAIACVSLAVLGWQYSWIRGRPRTSLRPVPAFLAVLFAAVLLVYGTLYLRQALAAETSPDAVTYHLGFVNLWSGAHRMFRLESMYAAMPQGTEMLFLFAFSIGKHSAAALVHLSLLLVLPFLIILYGLRFGISPAASVTAALLVFAAPLVGVDGSSAYIDVALAAFAFAAAWSLALWRQTRRNGALVAACLLAGFCLATKYTGVALALFAACVMVWEWRRDLRRLVSAPALAGFALLGASAAPYLVRNAVWYGNPVAPFANAIFRNPSFHISFEREYTRSHSSRNGVTWREAAVETTVGGPKLDGHFGPVFLLAPASLAGFVFPETRLLSAAAVAAAGTYPFNKFTRFLIPALPFIALSLAGVLGRLPRGPALLALIASAHIILSWPKVDTQPGWRLAHVPWRVALRQSPEEDYLGYRLAYYGVARAADRMIPPGQPVFSFTGLPQAYMSRVVLVSYESARAEKISDLFYANWRSPEDQRRGLAFPITGSPVRAVEITQEAADTAEMWSVNEIRFFAGGRPLQPTAGWKIEASPNPEDIALAFDGNEATRWRSWEPLRPGMRIRVDFDSAVPLTQLVLFANEGNRCRLRARVLADGGRWIPCAPAESVYDPPLDLRRAAVQAMRRMGVRYVVLPRNMWNAAAFYDAPGKWGLRTLYEDRAAKLVEAQ
jgi:hypothetical protein